MNARSSITVEANVVLDSIDPRLYGQNIEHMGRQVLGGLIAEPGSKAPQDSRGFRLDVLESIKNLNPPLLRWPGGVSRIRITGRTGSALIGQRFRIGCGAGF